jgi:DNA-3-methyladenine glycosylase II
MAEFSHRRAVAHLKAADPVLAEVIRRVGPYAPRIDTEGAHFAAFVRSILYQQLSGKAAATIHGRFLAHYGGRAPSPSEALETPESEWRALGVSRQKAAYLKDLAEKVASGLVPMDALHELDDATMIDRVTQVKGIGRWTAQMVLIFRLGRPDVLPDLDLGVQKAIKLAYGLADLPSPKAVLEIGAKWAPYRSVATWYLWRSLD